MRPNMFLFQFPHIISTFIFIIQTIFPLIILFSKRASKYDFPRVKTFIRTSPLLRKIPIIHILSILMCYGAYTFHKQIGEYLEMMKIKTRLNNSLRYIIFFSSICSVGGLIGYSNIHDIDLGNFEITMEFIYFTALILSFLSTDFLLHKIGYKTTLKTIIYDILLLFVIISFHLLYIFSTIIAIEEIKAVVSIFEYFSFIIVSFRFIFDSLKISQTKIFDKKSNTNHLKNQ